MVTYILGWLQNPGGSIESTLLNRYGDFSGGTRGALRCARPCGLSKRPEAFRAMPADRIQLAAYASRGHAGRAGRWRMEPGWLARVVAALCPPSLDPICHGHGRSGCRRDPVPRDGTRHPRPRLPDSAHRQPLVSLLACPPLKPALCLVVYVPPFPLLRPGCGFDLCRRASLWNQLRHGPGTFREPAALLHPALVLRDHAAGVAAIRPGPARDRSSASATTGSNALIPLFRFRRPREAGPVRRPPQIPLPSGCNCRSVCRASLVGQGCSSSR